jgi:hypothetical protein
MEERLWLFFGEEALEAAAFAAGGVIFGGEGDGLGGDLEFGDGFITIGCVGEQGQDARGTRWVSRGEK